MSNRNKFGNKSDSSRKESSFGNRDKSDKTDYPKYSNRFDCLDQSDVNTEETTRFSSSRHKRDDIRSSSRRFDKPRRRDEPRKFDDSSYDKSKRFDKPNRFDEPRWQDDSKSSRLNEKDDGFKPVNRKNHFNSGRRHEKHDRYRSSESSHSSYKESKTEKLVVSSEVAASDTQDDKTEKKNVFSINGPGYFKRKSMVDKINNGISMSTVIDINRLYNEVNPDIQPFIKQNEIEELNIVVWNYINEVETAHIHIMFDDYECDFMNPIDDKPADLLISKSKFMCMMSKILFYQNCIDFITNSISINLPDYSSERQEQINHVGTIGFAIHNDTPDSGIRIYELFHVIVFNMLNLFVQGYAGKAYCFKISPQGNRFNIEIRYDLDEFEDVQEAIKRIRLIATSYYNKIFSHLICFGCKQEGQRRPFMKYSFDGYVARKKTSEETENKEDAEKETKEDTEKE